ncbi:MAG: TrkH family potassium uptake protein [bacterium]|nr:TrkH family potassium uptake protein [bacterium]
MRFSIILNILGLLQVFIGIFMLMPACVALYYGEGDAPALFISAAISIVLGLAAFFLTRKHITDDIRPKEGFAIVTFGWIASALLGALPFYLSGAIPSVVDCVFETVSGYTTTGASILSNIEALPKGILFWRSLTHWLGGMGIILLSLAILPILGIGGMQLYKAEVPGPTSDKLSPRVRETAKRLWYIYLAFTIIEIALLYFGGMDLFDSACHTFGTMATGGFSTKNASIGQYNSAYFDYIIVVFMAIAGTNFALHYRAITGDVKAYFRDEEFKFFMGLMLFVIVIITIDIVLTSDTGFARGIRDSVFQTFSIGTTTGYGTADYEKWSSVSQFLLFMLMFIGGCAGSTGGGMKIVRIMLLLKYGIAELKKMIHPDAVVPVRFNNRPVSQDVVTKILGFFLLFVLLFVLSTLIMTMMGLDLLTALGSVAASLGNIGPGLGEVGPTDNYANIPVAGKMLLSFLMLIGRLEVFTILVIFHPSFWKR